MYQYRKIFGLNAQELADEPSDQFFTNLTIIDLIAEKERLEAKHGNS